MRALHSEVRATDTAPSLLAYLEQAIDAVVMIDDANNVTHFNAAAERMWGYDRSEVLGRNVSLLAPMAIRGQQDRHIAENGTTGINQIVGQSHEVTIKRKDGSRIRGSLSMSRVEVDGVIAYMGFVRDITEEVLRRSDITKLSMVVEKTNRAVFVTDADGHITYVNASFIRLFGYTLEQACGRTADELLHGSCTNQHIVERLRHLIRIEGAAEGELLVCDSAGHEVWVSVAINAIRGADGELQHLIALLTDITESKQLQTLQHHILEALADERPLIEIMDSLCHTVERIAPDVVCSLSYIDGGGRLYPMGGPNVPAEHIRLMSGIVIGPFSKSYGLATFNGETVEIADIAADPVWGPYSAAVLSAGLKACRITPIKAKNGRVIGTLTFFFRECRIASRWHQSIVDACVHLGALALEREEARNEISRLAYFDPLTGLPNRAHMRDLMERAVAERGGATMAVMFADLDHFKDVNDTLGHAVGDELLVAVSQRLQQNIRAGDIVSRQGGDEFIIMMQDCSADEAARVAARVTDALSAPLKLSGNQVSVSVSAGISMFPDHAADIDSLLKYADAAMYKAKQAGRSTYRFFCAEMDSVSQERLSFSTALRNAIVQGELKLHYQPQLQAKDGELYGVEALARWHDAERGDVSPARFIPLAEECGLIEQIGVWSLREACRQIADWHRAGLDVPRVSVNLSPINFENADLATLVHGIITENGLAPDMLTVEITEGVVASDTAIATRTMEAIRELGVGLSMDDFGAGYSSLSQLANLPVRELKIDRSFMRDIESEAGARAIATAVVRVGQSLDMTVVAEGVETEGQQRILAEVGCDVIQGFLHAPALATDDFERWFATHAAEQLDKLVRKQQALSARSSDGIARFAVKGVRQADTGRSPTG